MPTETLRTNRDLYLFIIRLTERFANDDRSLEEYLRALLGLTAAHQTLDALSLPLFAELLQNAFHADAIPIDPAWSHRSRPATARDQTRDYSSWRGMIIDQILDLAQMRAAGSLTSKLRNLGLDSPRGARWYNFEPIVFLECAAEGTFGGWQEGDSTGRQYVPGKVAVLDSEGKISSANPRALQEPTVQIDQIIWETFADFLWAAQSYE